MNERKPNAAEVVIIGRQSTITDPEPPASTGTVQVPKNVQDFRGNRRRRPRPAAFVRLTHQQQFYARVWSGGRKMRAICKSVGCDMEDLEPMLQEEMRTLRALVLREGLAA